MTRHISTVAFVGYALLIAWLSLSPPSDAGALFWDKALHATAYLIFVLLGSPLCLTCRLAHSPLSWRTASTKRKMPYMPGWV